MLYFNPSHNPNPPTPDHRTQCLGSTSHTLLELMNRMQNEGSKYAALDNSSGNK
jgi:hypothetical protein